MHSSANLQLFGGKEKTISWDCGLAFVCSGRGIRPFKCWLSQEWLFYKARVRTWSVVR